jgi:hypothetical protein
VRAGHTGARLAARVRTVSAAARHQCLRVTGTAVTGPARRRRASRDLRASAVLCGHRRCEISPDRFAVPLEKARPGSPPRPPPLPLYERRSLMCTLLRHAGDHRDPAPVRVVGSKLDNPPMRVRDARTGWLPAPPADWLVDRSAEALEKDRDWGDVNDRLTDLRRADSASAVRRPYLCWLDRRIQFACHRPVRPVPTGNRRSLRSHRGAATRSYPLPREPSLHSAGPAWVRRRGTGCRTSRVGAAW